MNALKEKAGKDLTKESTHDFLRMLHYVSFDTSQPQAYGKLKEKMETAATEHGIDGNCIFYLATPPDLYATIAQSLAMHQFKHEYGFGMEKADHRKTRGL